MSALERLDEGIWVAAAPQKFMGLHLGTRMTVVRRTDGGVIVHSPIAMDDALRGQVEATGPIRCIVAPNKYHHLHAGEWAAAVPDARLVGAQGLETKRADLRFDGLIGDEPDPGWAGTLEHVRIRGTMLGETVFFHAPTRTIISSDLLENFTTSDHWPTRMYLAVSGIHGKPGVGRMLRVMYRDREKVKAALERVLAWDFDRIVLAHGEIVPTNGKAVLRESYAWL